MTPPKKIGKIKNMKYCFLDFETANSERESICAVGISVRENGAEVDSFYSLVKPTPFRLDRRNQSVHGIEYTDLVDAPEFWKVYALFEHHLNGIVLTHNAAFDLSCLSAALDANHIIYPDFLYIDTLKIAHKKYEHTKLSDLAEIYGVPYKDAHNALADARMLGEIYERMRLDFCPEICGYDMQRFKPNPFDFPTYPQPTSQKQKTSKDAAPQQKTVDDLPFAVPDKIEFAEKKFVVTGEFATIPRKRVEEIVLKNGGTLQSAANSKSSYIIVGSVAASGWANGNYGRKIEQALKQPNIIFVSESVLKNFREFTL